MIVVHEVVSSTLKSGLDNFGGLSEASEDVGDVVSLLHGDDSHVVLLIEPHEEVPGIVMEDTTGIGPVATASRGKEEGGVGLLEEVSGVAESFLHSLAHATGLGLVGARSSEGEVVSLELTVELHESSNDELLDLAAL